MSDKDEFYWHDMEPLDDDDQFFTDLCDLIDEHAEDEEERLLYLCALADFKHGWMESYGATGALWM